MSIKTEVSVGELLDKITILQIKTEKITAPEKLKNVNKELSVLTEQWEASEYGKTDLSEYIRDLKAINEKLWQIEDDIREKERRQDFDQGFIELARAVYFSNDRRASIKRAINGLAGSDLTEEKSYSDYG